MAFGQSTGNAAPVGNILTQAFGSNVTAGKTLLVATVHDNTKTSVSLLDTVGTNYGVSLGTVNLNGEIFDVYAGVAAGSGPNTVVNTLSGIPADGAIIVAEYSGRDLVSPVGNTTTNNQATPGTGANGVTCGPVTALLGDDVVHVMVDVDAARTNNFSAGTGFTERFETASFDMMLQSSDNVSAGAITGLATSANNELVFSFIVCLKQASGGGSTPIRGKQSGNQFFVEVDLGVPQTARQFRGQQGIIPFGGIGRNVQSKYSEDPVFDNLYLPKTFKSQLGTTPPLVTLPRVYSKSSMNAGDNNDYYTNAVSGGSASPGIIARSITVPSTISNPYTEELDKNWNNQSKISKGQPGTIPVAPKSIWNRSIFNPLYTDTPFEFANSTSQTVRKQGIIPGNPAKTVKNASEIAIQLGREIDYFDRYFTGISLKPAQGGAPPPPVTGSLLAFGFVGIHVRVGSL